MCVRKLCKVSVTPTWPRASFLPACEIHRALLWSVLCVIVSQMFSFDPVSGCFSQRRTLSAADVIYCLYKSRYLLISTDVPHPPSTTLIWPLS